MRSQLPLFSSLSIWEIGYIVVLLNVIYQFQVSQIFFVNSLVIIHTDADLGHTEKGGDWRYNIIIPPLQV